jgi:aspartate/methionine/tyrosine aminotransferase
MQGFPVVSRRLSQLGSYSLLVVQEWKEEVKRSGKRLVDTSLGDPREPTPEFIRESIKSHILPETSYPPGMGLPELRRSAAHWLERRFGVAYPEQKIVPTAGSKEGIFHFPFLLEPGLRIAYPVPGYPVYENAIHLSGHTPVPLLLKPEHGFALRPSDLEELQAQGPLGAVWVCSPHNPTGTQLTRAQMDELVIWCRKNQVLLLSDECYADSVDPGEPLPHSFLEWGCGQSWAGVVAFFSLSKRSGMTGYRSGFVAGDDTYISAYQRFRPHAGLASPDFIQRAAAAAWADDVHAHERAKIFASKRQVVWQALDKMGWTYVPSAASLYVWACLPIGRPAAEDAREYLAALARETGIVATPGDCFGASPLVKPWLRVALVPSVEQLADAMKLWAAFDSRFA